MSVVLAPTTPATRPRVALVHDYFTQLGGAERFIEHLADMFPAARIHAAFADSEMIPPRLQGRVIGVTFVQRVRRPGAPLAPFAPLLPYAFGRVGLGGCDIVISCSSAFAHHVRVPAGGSHIWYCHTPPRFLWQSGEYFAKATAKGTLVSPGLAVARRLDRAAAARAEFVIANSHYTAERLRDTYGREARVIHPPVPVDEFAPSHERSGRFLIVSRLRRHKRLELAIKAADTMHAPLDVIGAGPDLQRLRRIAGPTIRFLGRRSDDEVRDAMARCTALIVPAAEDFGLTMVEAQASGRPPVAFAGGGALEIIRDGHTGFLFDEADVQSLIVAMERARASRLSADELVESARRFDLPLFERAISEVVAEAAARNGGR